MLLWIQKNVLMIYSETIIKQSLSISIMIPKLFLAQNFYDLSPEHTTKLSNFEQDISDLWALPIKYGIWVKWYLRSLPALVFLVLISILLIEALDYTHPVFTLCLLMDYFQICCFFCLLSCYACDLQTSSITVLWKLVRNPNSQPPLYT